MRSSAGAGTTSTSASPNCAASILLSFSASGRLTRLVLSAHRATLLPEVLLEPNGAPNTHHVVTFIAATASAGPGGASHEGSLDPSRSGSGNGTPRSGDRSPIHSGIALKPNKGVVLTKSVEYIKVRGRDLFREKRNHLTR